MEDRHESRNQSMSRSQLKHHFQLAPSLPTQLPAGADLPSCTECNDNESKYPKLELPGTDYMPLNRQDARATTVKESPLNSSQKPAENENSSNSNGYQPPLTPRSSASGSSQLLAQKKLFAESQVGRSSFQKLLEPSLPQRPGIAPYRIVLGDVKDK
ncbi:hypothetical protein CRG98_039223, partial [Punica granatum]